MELTIIELLQGIFSLIFIIISIIIGLHILLKYFEHKRRELIFVGLTWIGMTLPWLGDAINLILIVLYNSILDISINFILIIAFLPLTTLCWLIAFTDLVYKKGQKVILGLYLVIGILVEILFFLLLLENPSNLGRYIGPFQIEYSLLTQIYIIFTLISFVLSGIILARQSLRAENPDIKLKGKLLLFAFILLTIGAALDSIAPLVPLTVVFARIILILSAIAFYGGFMLPNWMKKIFLKES